MVLDNLMLIIKIHLQRLFVGNTGSLAQMVCQLLVLPAEMIY